MDYVDYTLDPADLDMQELLDYAQEQERQRVAAELQEIEQALAARDDLHDRIVDDLETKLDWYVDRLRLLYKRFQGKHGTRDRLKTRIEAIYEALRTERRVHWRDRQDLLADRRELRRERCELDDESLQRLLQPP